MLYNFAKSIFNDDYHVIYTVFSYYKYNQMQLNIVCCADFLLLINYQIYLSSEI